MAHEVRSAGVRVAPSTLRKYSAGLADLAAFLGQPTSLMGLRHLAHVGPLAAAGHVRRWIEELESRGLAASTVAGRLAALKFGWACVQRAGVVDWVLGGFCAQEPAVSTPRLGLDEMHALLGAALRQPPHRAQRDHALLLVLGIAGVPVGVLPSLRVEDFDEAGRRLHLRGGVGQLASAWVLLGDGVAGSLSAYLRARKALPGEPLFVTLASGHDPCSALGASGIYRTVTGLGVAAGIGHRVTPRCLASFSRATGSGGFR
ncbi:MAG: site-specific integrase [Myxococcales bacterium]|nr:site-specific integrase [Myxococcales bacterium]